ASAGRAPDEQLSCARTGSQILAGPIQKDSESTRWKEKGYENFRISWIEQAETQRGLCLWA
ncbi:MAG: hypothetical protein ACYSTZ_11295, partial [Planctomycetota bacterium]